MEKQLFDKYANLITNYATTRYMDMFREPAGNLHHKFIVPGSARYNNCLWDWDSWLTNIALRQIAPHEAIFEYEKGCIRNFFDFTDPDGRIPICIIPKSTPRTTPPQEEGNIHKPCLAQHTLFIVEQSGDAEWMREGFPKIELFINFYRTKCYHEETGLFVWINDGAIGVDNDPCTFFRTRYSSASIYLNCFMYKELEATAKLAELLGYPEKVAAYLEEAEKLKKAIREQCWDERDGFYYSVDTSVLPVNPNDNRHKGCPRHWGGLIQRIGVWSGFLAMWAGIATPEQAERMVKEHYLNEKTFNAPFGVRTLSKMEKMYLVVKSGNPSCWLGPIWGISNYMTFDGLRRYGYDAEARELAEKTITMFGQDIEEHGEMSEYYHPELGLPMNNPGFQNWNLLSLDMITWMKEKFMK